jgi:hypothetical protein
MQELVKQQGMETLASESNKSLMRMLADTMSQVAEQTWETDSKWMGILETMHKFITSNDAHLVEVALVLFSKLTEWLGQDPVMLNMQRQMYDVLLQFLQNAPNDDVRIAACKASTNFILVRPARSITPPSILCCATVARVLLHALPSPAIATKGCAKCQAHHAEL